MSLKDSSLDSQGIKNKLLPLISIISASFLLAFFSKLFSPFNNKFNIVNKLGL